MTQIQPVQGLSIAATGQQLLALLTTVLTEMNVTLPTNQGPVPSPTLDGEQFTVKFMGITRGAPGAPDNRPIPPNMLMQYVEYEIDLIRSVSGIQSSDQNIAIPDMAQKEADYIQMADDASDLWDAIVSVHASYSLVSSGTPFLYGPLLPVGPEGGLAGVRCPVYFSLV